jgi:two-component system chemotaxis response regulator CheY
VSVVLLIDDEPAMGGLVDVWVSELGARVVQVATLDQAVEAARAGDVDAILLDISLNHEDGLDLFARLEEEGILIDTPVIAFSIHDSRRREAFAKGAKGFVRKPFRSEDLQSTLREHLS